MAARLRAIAGQDDLIARLGGDEFVVVQAGPGQPAGSMALAHRLVDRVSEPYDIAGHPVIIGTSVGIAVPAAGETIDRLLSNADFALYAAKAAGRGTVRVFDLEMGALLACQRELAQDLREAIDHGQIEVHYQPIFLSTTGEVVAAGKRLGMATHRVEFVTGAGRATIEFGHLDGAGEAGALITRFLLEMIDAPPTAAARPLDEIPLHAEMHVAPRGSLVFDAISLARKPDLSVADVLVPPADCELNALPIDDVPSALLVTKEDLAGLHQGPGANDGTDAGTGFGLSLFNATDRVRFAALDGIPVAWLAPGSRINVPAPRGHWLLQWRTFFGDEVSSAEPVTLPAVRTIGDPDAGGGRSNP